VKVRVLVSLVTLGVVVSVALYAVHATSPSTRHVVRARYSTSEILEFLLFSTGRVVSDHPGLHQQRTVAALADRDAHAAVESVARCVDHLDAAAGPALTAAFNAADPQRLDSALQRLDAAGRRWMTAPHKEAPCPDPPPPPKYGGESQDPGGKGWWRSNGYGYLYFVFYGADFYAVAFTVGGALILGVAGAVALVVLVAATFLLVPVFITYQFQSTPTDLDHQIAIAKLARELRS
jgi:hypothetical protein